MFLVYLKGILFLFVPFILICLIWLRHRERESSFLSAESLLQTFPTAGTGPGQGQASHVSQEPEDLGPGCRFAGHWSQKLRVDRGSPTWCLGCCASARSHACNVTATHHQSQVWGFPRVASCHCSNSLEFQNFEFGMPKPFPPSANLPARSLAVKAGC